MEVKWVYKISYGWNMESSKLQSYIDKLAKKIREYSDKDR